MSQKPTGKFLQHIMADRNLRQVDVLKLCQPYCKQYGVKIGKNDLSQYVSGKHAPGSKKYLFYLPH